MKDTKSKLRVHILSKVNQLDKQLSYQFSEIIAFCKIDFGSIRIMKNKQVCFNLYKKRLHKLIAISTSSDIAK